MARLGPSRLTGHLGSSVSALVDGQLDGYSTERAWQHVEHCPSCRRLVEHEGWVKRQLAHIAETPSPEVPSDRFVGALLDLDPTDAAWGGTAWTDTADDRGRGRGRRRAGIALVGAGSVSAAVLGFSTLSGVPVGFGGSTSPGASIGRASSPSPATATPSPSSSSSSAGPTGAPLLPVVAPSAGARGQLPAYLFGADPSGLARTRLASVDR